MSVAQPSPPKYFCTLPKSGHVSYWPTCRISHSPEFSMPRYMGPGVEWNPPIDKRYNIKRKGEKGKEEEEKEDLV